MRNFIMGLILGICATYLYLEGGAAVTDVANDVWSRVSKRPPGQYGRP